MAAFFRRTGVARAIGEGRAAGKGFDGAGVGGTSSSESSMSIAMGSSFDVPESRRDGSLAGFHLGCVADMLPPGPSFLALTPTL